MRTPKPTESTARLIEHHVYLEARLTAELVGCLLPASPPRSYAVIPHPSRSSVR